jgi:hypothetical protein
MGLIGNLAKDHSPLIKDFYTQKKKFKSTLWKQREIKHSIHKDPFKIGRFIVDERQTE